MPDCHLLSILFYPLPCQRDVSLKMLMWEALAALNGCKFTRRTRWRFIWSTLTRVADLFSASKGTYRIVETAR